MAKTKTETTTPAVSKAAATPKKPAAAKKSATVATAKRTAAPRTAAKHNGHAVPVEQRAHYIEVAAFYIAERRGFAPANPVDDWLAAEAEIDRLLAEGRLG